MCRRTWSQAVRISPSSFGVIGTRCAWRNSDPCLTEYLSFFPLGLGIKALGTGFCSYSMSLCKSSFRRPVCSSNSETRKSDLNQTNTHLPSAFQTYYLLILCGSSLSRYKHPTLLSSVPLWSDLALQQICSNLTSPGSLLGSACPYASQARPVLSARSALC